MCPRRNTNLTVVECAQSSAATSAEKLADAQLRLTAAERQLVDLRNIERVRRHVQQAKLSSAFLKTAPGDYYSWSLAQRACVTHYLSL